MSMLIRILKSLRDGSFAIKVLNRFSRVKYVPAPEPSVDPVDKYIAKHYLGDGWRSWSSDAKKVWIQFSPIFDKFEIHTIAYVGANEGTTALALDEAFAGLEFYLLEPVPQVFETLVRNTTNHRNMRCLNVAAGAEEAWCDMFVDGYSPASSLLRYEPTALQEFPFLGKQVIAKVHVKPLDNILRDCEAGDVDLLLMDVQGYEDKVLQGANRTIKSCKVVISELSLQPLYVGSSTFGSVYQALVGEGFQLQYLVNPLTGVSHQILQIDGVFVRDSVQTR
jgi:FkbM family methyltransferase